MSDRRLNEAAAARRQHTLDESATPSEKLRLLAEQDQGVILIRMGFDQDLLMRIDGQPDPGPLGKLDDDLAAHPPSAQANEIVRRIRLRTELGLPRRDCGSRLQREGCSCLGRALDQLINVHGVNRDRVMSLSREIHKETRAVDRERKRAEKAQRKEADRRAKEAREASKSSSASPAQQAPTVKRAKASPRPGETLRRRRHREPPHPLSIEAFRRSQRGPSVGNIMEKEF
jgi:hypothetical protein